MGRYLQCVRFRLVWNQPTRSFVWARTKLLKLLAAWPFIRSIRLEKMDLIYLIMMFVIILWINNYLEYGALNWQQLQFQLLVHFCPFFQLLQGLNQGTDTILVSFNIDNPFLLIKSPILWQFFSSFRFLWNFLLLEYLVCWQTSLGFLL